MIERQSYLRTALTNIHRDPRWWRTVLLGGACMLSVVGVPFASGLVVENLENANKGYPTPLPPWVDLGTRYLIGLFALLIDFVFFVMPLLLGGAVLLCVLVATVFGSGAGNSNPTLVTLLSRVIGGIIVVFELGTWLLGLSPVARLIFVEEGRIEDALGGEPLRKILAAPARGIYVRARLASLPAYLPAALLALATWGATTVALPVQFLILLVLIWLSLSALLYGALATAQIYALAERDIQRLEMSARMARRSQ